MDFTNIIETFENDELKQLIINPLIDSLTAMNKYSVLPVYVLQFVINKLDMVPHPILTAYDNKPLITEASSLLSHLEDVIHEKTPKNITPAVIVYPEYLNYRDIILGNSDSFYYSSAYLIVGKELKDYLKNGKINISKVELVSDMSRLNVVTKLYWNIVDSETVDESGTKESIHQCIDSLPFSIKTFKLPFSNYIETAKSLRSIVSSMSNVSDNNSILIEHNLLLASMFDDVKENQMINIPGTKSIKIFKDFVKVKPNKIFSVFEQNKYDSDSISITNVFFEMYFKSSHLNVGIFYRYLDDIFDTLNGVYKE